MILRSAIVSSVRAVVSPHVTLMTTKDRARVLSPPEDALVRIVRQDANCAGGIVRRSSQRAASAIRSTADALPWSPSNGATCSNSLMKSASTQLSDAIDWMLDQLEDRTRHDERVGSKRVGHAFRR